MAGGMRRLMELLGLADPPYEDEYVYEDPMGQPPAAPQGRVGGSRSAGVGPDDGVGAIRPIPRDPLGNEPVSGVTPIARPVRPLAPVREPKVHVTEPQEYADGQEIADQIRAGNPVIVSVVNTEPAIGRRLIDFCSACVYMVEGSMQRVAKSVFLLTPPNVEVSDAEKRRLKERGLYKLDI
jgi:cell division inhibitor SepF